jgi:hypothetical protein
MTSAAPAARAHVTADAARDLAAAFMLDARTRERGAELGFPGARFDIVGRAGVLGRVAPDVVTAALVFFDPDAVRRAWTAGLEVMDPRDVSAVYAAAAHTWARRLPDTVEAARLAGLTGRVIDAAEVAGAPLFAGWRAMPEPDDPKALALHRLHVLRELRSAVVGIGTLAAGVGPHEAVMADDPERAAAYGWSADLDADGPHDPHDRRAEARDLSGRLLARAFSVLDDHDHTELATLIDGALAAARADRPALV